MTKSRKSRWEGYAVTNDDVLVLLDKWRKADLDGKTRISTQLILRLTYLVQSHIKKHKGRAFYDDLFQEGRMGLLKAVEDFNPQRGVNFFKFAKWHIQTKVRRFLYKEIRRADIPSGVDFSIENSVADVQCLDEMVEQAESQRIVNDALRKLIHRERDVLIGHFGIGISPMTLQQIGDGFGVSRERVRQIECKALSKLKKNMEIREYCVG